jgi:hypothetical protein
MSANAKAAQATSTGVEPASLVEFTGRLASSEGDKSDRTDLMTYALLVRQREDAGSKEQTFPMTVNCAEAEAMMAKIKDEERVRIVAHIGKGGSRNLEVLVDDIKKVEGEMDLVNIVTFVGTKARVTTFDVEVGPDRFKTLYKIWIKSNTDGLEETFCAKTYDKDLAEEASDGDSVRVIGRLKVGGKVSKPLTSAFVTSVEVLS